MWLIATHYCISRLIRRVLMDSLSLPAGSLVFLAPFFPDTPNKFAYSQVNRLCKIVIIIFGGVLLNGRLFSIEADFKTIK